MGHIMGRITTHVLDTAHGKPGQGVAVQLYQIKDGQRIAVCSVQTNADGRCDQPLLESDALNTGVYEIDFDVGSYFQKWASTCQSPASLA